MAATAIVGEIKLSGSMGEVRHLESDIRVAKNAGARRILLPMQCMADVVKIPSELLATVQPLFYMDAIDAAKKALDIYKGGAAMDYSCPKCSRVFPARRRFPFAPSAVRPKPRLPAQARSQPRACNRSTSALCRKNTGI